MEFDVRNQSESFESIRVNDGGGMYISANVISKHSIAGQVELVDEIGGSDTLIVFNAEHARNLIKGLQKAIDIGWLV